MPLIAGFGQAVTDIGFVRAIEHGGLHMPARGLGNISKFDFQHLTDVHTGRSAQGVQHDRKKVKEIIDKYKMLW